MGNALGARKNAKFKAVSAAPSINQTPAGSAMVPVAYPVISDLSGSMGTVSNVKFNGDPAYVLDQSTQPSCKGDNPGTGKGVKSGTLDGEVKPAKGSSTVRAGKKAVVRHGDRCTMQGGNCHGTYVTVPAPLSPKNTQETRESQEKALQQLKAAFEKEKADDPFGLKSRERRIDAILQNIAAKAQEAQWPSMSAISPEDAAAAQQYTRLKDAADAADRNVSAILNDDVSRGVYDNPVFQGVLGEMTLVAVGGLAKGAVNGLKSGGKSALKVGGEEAKVVAAGEDAAKAAGRSGKAVKAEKAMQESATAAKASQAKTAGAKTGKDGVKVSKQPKFRRSMSERRKALLRDANDPNSKLTNEQRDFIKKNNGNKVPNDCEVSHDTPLYTEKTIEGKKSLDTADNMTTISKDSHRTLHKTCGDTFHDFPR